MVKIAVEFIVCKSIIKKVNNAAMLTKIYQSILQCMVPESEKDTFETVGNEVKKLIGAKYCSIILKREGVIQRVWASSPIFYIINPRSAGTIATVFRTKKSSFLTGEEIEKIHPPVKLMEIGSSLAVPLKISREVFGVISILSKKRQIFSKKDKIMLENFAPVAALTIKKAMLHDNLQKALTSRDLFISMAAHELKNPLTTIYAYTQLIDNKIAKNQLPDKKNTTILLFEEVRLTKMIDTMLELSHIRRGSLQFKMQPVDLVNSLNRAVINLRSRYPFHKIILKNDLDKTGHHLISGDQDRLIEAFTNILTNAAKYSQINSIIRVTLKSNDSSYLINIQDEGIGISPDNLSQIFKPFYREVKTRSNGLGLGLYLVKNIVDKHHGTITITSKINRGTSVVVSFPRCNTNELSRTRETSFRRLAV